MDDARSDDELVTAREVEQRLREEGLRPRWSGARPEAFSAFTDDSRDVGEGALFCAVDGHEADGHDYVDEARRAGAAAAVVEREVEAGGLPQVVVEDSRAAAAHLSALFRGDPSRDLRVTGVTGTDGKTTTAWLLRHLFSTLGPTASLGTLGVVRAEGDREPDGLTTPGPVRLASELARLRDAGTERVVLEVSSHALDQRRADALELTGLVLTNLSREHQDYHADMEAYRAAKLRALDLLASDGICAVNADEEAWEGVAAPRGRTVSYGVGGDARVRAEAVRTVEGGTRWRLVAPEGAAEVRLPLPGGFNVHNALGAAALALAEGMGPEEVAERLSRAPQVPGRMEVLSRGPVLVVRDYAHTPEALRRVLVELRPDSGRLFVVFGCGGDRDTGKRPLMGRAAADEADHAFVTTDNPRSEDPAEIARQVTEGMGPGDADVVLDRREAIARALETAEPGDVVLLSGKGHEDYQDLGDRKVPFDEARIVEELVGRAGGGPDGGRDAS